MLKCYISMGFGKSILKKEFKEKIANTKEICATQILMYISSDNITGIQIIRP